MTFSHREAMHQDKHTSTLPSFPLLWTIYRCSLRINLLNVKVIQKSELWLSSDGFTSHYIPAVLMYENISSGKGITKVH